MLNVRLGRYDDSTTYASFTVEHQVIPVFTINVEGAKLEIANQN